MQKLINLKVEKRYIGILIENPDLFERVKTLPSDYFSDKFNRQVFEEMKNLYGKSGKFDSTILESALRLSKVVNDEVTEEKYYDLIESSKNAVNFENYHTTLTSLNTANKFYTFFEEGKKEIEKSFSDDSSYITKQTLLTLDENYKNLRSSISDISSITSKTARELLSENPDSYLGGVPGDTIYTHFVELDSMIGNISSDMMVVIGGSPNSGKTAFLMNVMMNLSKYQNKKSLFINFEMSTEKLIQRFINSVTGISLRRLQTANTEKLHVDQDLGFTKEEWEKISAYNENNITENILFPTQMPRNYPDLEAMIYKEKERHDLSLIGIDYGQCMHYPQGENDSVRYVNLCLSLIKLSADLKVPIFVISQLNKMSMMEDSNFSLASFRGSSGWGESSSIAIILNSTKKISQNSLVPTEFHILKARQGKKGLLTMDFDISRNLFHDSYSLPDYLEMDTNGIIS